MLVVCFECFVVGISGRNSIKSMFGSKARSTFKSLFTEKWSIFLVEKMSKVLMACIQTDPKCVSFDLVFQFLISVVLEWGLGSIYAVVWG